MTTHPNGIGIAIVAPSGFGSDNAAIERGIASLVAQGHTVHNYFEADKVFQRFGGTDDARLAQLDAAACDPQVQVVMALRGQYGLTRLLPRIDFARMAASGKIFVGYSDFTAFHMGLMAKTGAQSYAGPMFYSDFGTAEPVAFTQDDFWHCLRGPRHVIRACADGNPALATEGTIWGGNLAMLISLVGTDYFARIDDGIVFVEDINEHPYRVERMLLQLLQSGVLARQKALVLGDFSGYRLTPADNGYDFAAMLAYLRATLPIPVLTGLQFGHMAQRVTIPFGAHAQLVSDDAGFTLTMSGYPTIAHA
ncbi:muramoyltetrapeptide carboxypeptidase [Massilia atriviolacea]|uniref:Muramoyltetrapeptide carboxypeptidase n=1 Tax=Massilia atriviolacea TaxID=2495579 RepID=A0A430HTS4_9BURK|nr:muramoyltetrapeptide carboxypeptidase [Massilia atriviolacea]RSZ60784.1 muramoyltetrapeptide carboxypeptidase [Massilia atriviolacea]